MTLILGIDCCSGWTNIGLAEDGQPLGEINLKSGRRQASLLPHLVSELLENVQMDLKDISLLAVTSGPGYFTGIRVGMAYVAALASGLGLRVVTLSSLETLVWEREYDPCPKLSVIPSGKEKVFGAVYQDNKQIIEPALFYFDELISRISETLPNYLFTLECYSTEVEKIKTILEPAGISTIRASISRGMNVALLGSKRMEYSLLPEDIKPSYLAEPQTS